MQHINMQRLRWLGHVVREEENPRMRRAFDAEISQHWSLEFFSFQIYNLNNTILLVSEISSESFFSILISTLEILNIQSESTILIFNYVLWFIHTRSLKHCVHKYRLQWVHIQRWHQTHTIRHMFDSIHKPTHLDSLL